MTTYQQGKQPDGALVTWRRVTDPDFDNYIVFAVTLAEGNECEVSDENQAEAICRWAHLAKLAEDYAKAKAAMDAAATAAEIESVRAAYYDAARALCEAVRA